MVIRSVLENFLRKLRKIFPFKIKLNGVRIKTEILVMKERLRIPDHSKGFHNRIVISICEWIE